MNLSELRDRLAANAAESAHRAGAITLGELRDRLAVLPPETPVFLPDGDTPRALSSYRGYYERLAIEASHTYPAHTETQIRGVGQPGFESDILGYYQPGASDVTIAAPCTTGELVKALDIADGEEFEGYKGGQNTMSRDTFMHVADHGDCGPCVSGLRVEADRVVIETTAEEF